MNNNHKKTKSAPKLLKVTFGDGSVIQEKTATETYVETIRHIGVEKVANLTDVRIEGLPLVVKQVDYRMQMRPLDDGWYVCTHSSTIAKQRMLEKISERLELNLIIEVI